MGAKLHRVASIEGVSGIARALGVTVAVLVGGFACGNAGTEPVTDAAGLLLDAGGQGDAAAPDALSPVMDAAAIGRSGCGSVVLERHARRWCPARVASRGHLGRPRPLLHLANTAHMPL